MKNLSYSFQVDHPIVKYAYDNMDNYLIIEEHNDLCKCPRPLCALYFSGHSIYYPNKEDVFNETIIKRNRFEWYGLRFKNTSKHIFLRDIHKQWYISGINNTINTPQLLYEFLKKETEGYDIVCIGSSAGGYAALLYGSLLNAKISYAFSAQVELNSLLTSSSPELDPLIFRYQNTDLRKYFDIVPFMEKGKDVKYYYFTPIKNKGDLSQMNHILSTIGEVPNKFTIIRFSTKKHGVPFPKVALPKIMTYNPLEFMNKVKKINHPIYFAIRMVGLGRAIKGIFKQLWKHYFK